MTQNTHDHQRRRRKDMTMADGVNEGSAAMLGSLVRRLLGWAMILSPFLAIAAILWALAGWSAVAVVYGVTALVAGAIGIGVALAGEAGND